MTLVRLQLRYSTTAEWETENPVLAAAEPGYDTTVGSMKIGDGTTPWTGLEYQSTDPAQLDALLTEVQAAQAAAEAAQAAAELAAESATGATDAGVAALVGNPASDTREALDLVYAPLAHEHTADEISDFAAAVESLLTGFLVPGTNVTINHTGATFVISASGGGSGLDAEALMDFLGGVTAALKGIKGAGLVQVTYDDAADKITIATTATQNQTDSYLLDRTHHTGEVPINTMASDWSDTAPTAGQQPAWNAASGKYTPTTPPDPNLKADKSGSVRQFADWDDGAAADDNVPFWDAGLGRYVPLNPASKFAEADPTTGKLIVTDAPKYNGFTIIVDEGDPIPLDAPIGLGYAVVGYSRPAAPSLTPVMEDGGFVLADDQVLLQNAEAYAIGDLLVLVCGSSGEATLPSSFTLTIESPGVAPQSLRVSASQTGSAQCDIYSGKVTTAIPAGSDLTISTFNPSAVAQNRAQLHAVILKLPNTAAVPFDKQAAANAGSSGVLDLNIGPVSTPLSQPNECGIAAWCFNSGTGATVRTIAPTNGWQTLYNAEAEAAAARTLLVAYKVFDAGGSPSATAHVTASDSASGAWAGAAAYFKSV